MIRIVHSADFEIGPSGERLDPETGLNARMVDRAKCAKFVIEDGIARGGQLVLIAGDVWRGSGESAYGCRPTPTQVWLAREALRPAIAAGVPVVIIQGNHDMARSTAEKGALDLIRDTEGLTIVEWPCLLNVWQHNGPGWAHPGEPSEGACTVEPAGERPPDGGADLALQIACLPYPNRAQLLTDEEARKLAPGDLNLLIRERMMDIARDLASKRIPGVPAVLLGHFAVDTAAAGAQNTLGMMMGEWSMSLYELDALGFDGILLGHYHRPQDLSDGTRVIYAGSPEVISFSEEGEAKSYVLWQIDPDDIPVTKIPTPQRQFVTLTAADFQVKDDGSTDVVCEPFPAGAIVRLEIPPGSWLTVADARRTIEAAGAFEARVSQIRAETVRRRETDVSEASTLADAVDAYLEQHPDLKPLRDDLQAMAAEVVRETT